MNNRSKRRGLILITIIIILLLGAGYFAYIQLTSYQKLTINLSSKVANPKIIVSLVENGDLDVGHEYTNVGTEIKLEKGEYNVRFGADDYKQIDTKIKLGDSPQKITITPSYSDVKLQDLLNAQQTELKKTINSKFPQTLSTYKIEPGKLYLLGDWYATTIKLKQTAQEERENYIDIYRIVLKKNSNIWEVVTSPPEITLASPKYPEIPKEILIDVNKNPEDN